MALLTLAAAEPESFIVTLWANGEVDALPGVISSGPHPCGASAEVRVTAMPPHRSEEGPLGTELVVETDQAGRELGRWSVPVDYEPLAIRGPDLLLRAGEARLWIGRDGGIRRDTGGDGRSRPTPALCPAGGPFEDSAYARCALFPDLATGRSRFLRYEAVCT